MAKQFITSDYKVITPEGEEPDPVDVDYEEPYMGHDGSIAFPIPPAYHNPNHNN